MMGCVDTRQWWTTVMTNSVAIFQRILIALSDFLDNIWSVIPFQISLLYLVFMYLVFTFQSAEILLYLQSYVMMKSISRKGHWVIALLFRFFTSEQMEPELVSVWSLFYLLVQSMELSEISILFSIRSLTHQQQMQEMGKISKEYPGRGWQSQEKHIGRPG